MTTYRVSIPPALAAYLRYGRRRKLQAQIQAAARIAVLIVAGISIPLLTWAGIWLAWLLFKA